jgi:hypothetical protein
MPRDRTQAFSPLATLAAGPDFALLSAFMPGLPNTVLVQLVRTVWCDPFGFSLYATYREGNVTFDAIARFEVGDASAALADVLKGFVASDDFERAVVAPILREVRAHFKRGALDPA